jgi:hypothetical protein
MSFDLTMKTVDELLAQEPPSPAFQLWFDGARNLRARNEPLSKHLSVRLAEVERIIALAFNGHDQTIEAMISSGFRISALIEVHAWMAAVISAESKERADP